MPTEATKLGRQQNVQGLSSPTAVMPETGRQNTKRPETFARRYRTEIAASSSSVFSTLTAFPLDSVKTRMQTYQYNGFLDCVKHTYRTERLAGFFRGMSGEGIRHGDPQLLCEASQINCYLYLPPPSLAHRLICLINAGVTAPMASITLVRTVSFSMYQRAKHVYCNWAKRNFGIDILGHVNKPGTYPTIYSVACFGAAGATAGSAITFLACPFELTKLSAQVSVLLAERAGQSQRARAMASSYQNKGTLRTMANIIKHRGIFGLYTGFRLHLRKSSLVTMGETAAK